MAEPNLNEIPLTPTAVSDAVLHPHPLTLGQICLLEKIDSPFVKRVEDDPTGFDYAPSIFLLSLPAAEGCKHLGDNLTAEAMAYVDTLSLEDFRKRIQEGYAAVNAFYDALPRATEEEDAGKNGSAATASS